VLKTEQSLAGDSLTYLDKMERNSEEDRRKAREKMIMEEGKALWQRKQQEEEELRFMDVEEIKEITKQRMFGRPGHGAPTQDIRKKRFTEHQLDRGLYRSQSMFGLDNEEDYGGPESAPLVRFNSELDLDQKDALCFGRGGNGAPLRTKSGRLRTTVYANPEIRFQANESVQKSITNNIRYAVDGEDKNIYQQELEDQIRQKLHIQEMQKSGELTDSKQMAEIEGTQWGKAGPGGAYWRDSAVTGQGFFDKMGWATSADPRRRQAHIKKNEVEEMKREMSEIEKRRAMEHKEMVSEIGTELAPLMKNSIGGKPRKDPNTGQMMDHSLSSTDVTRLAVSGPQAWHQGGNKHQYSDQLSGQVAEKQDIGARGKEMDELQQKQHFESWESFWGRPGYGAPRDSIQKENLMKMLHYSDAQAPNNVELITLERLPVKH